MGLESWLVLPDLHYPYHDIRYIKLVKKIATILSKDNGFRGVIQLGDAVDWWQLSKYDKDPQRLNTAFDDLCEYSGFIDEMEGILPRGSVWHQLCGNHEDRLRRYIYEKAPKLQQMISSIPEMLKFQERNKRGKVKCIWHPYERWDSCKIGDCRLFHGVYFNAHVAAGNLLKYGVKSISGHTHRFQKVSNGKHWAISLGHGSDEIQTAHSPVPTGWVQAFAVLHSVNGVTHAETVLADHGSCVFRGQVVKA